MAGRSILDVLSLEVVDLVLQESKKCDQKGFHDLRLVCKALNKLVEPQVFSTVTIQFEKDDSGKWKSIPEFLMSLASGTSPYVHWAKELLVVQLVPNPYRETDVNYSAKYDQWLGANSEREMMLACQKEWLAPAIESLVQLERVHFMADSSEPYHDALCALTKLPQLQTLGISFRGSPSGCVPLERFSNLSDILLYGLTMTRQTVESLKCLLTRSPSITGLTLDARTQPSETEVNAADLASLLKDAIEPPTSAIARDNQAPTFSSTLKRLKISARWFKLSPSCAPFLHALTSLLISGDSAHVQASFWKSLQDSGIHLQELNVGPLLQPIIDYLLSYSGLREFVLDPSDWDKEEGENVTHPSQDHQDDENIAHQFFHSVLPMHQSSIQTVAFRNTKPGSWAIAQPYLEGVFLCKNLKFLTLVYHFPMEGLPTIALADLLSKISDNLPRLQTLRLYHTRKHEMIFGPDRSILDVLPSDIMELVVQEGKNHDSKDFCNLRLVCKALNELVEPEVFSAVTIQFLRDDSGRWEAIPEFLSSLASGTSPYVRWAKKLRLSGLIPIIAISHWSQYDPWQGEEHETMLACQKEFLAPAIESLVHVEVVEYLASSREPYQDALSALAKLPRLRDLLITFHTSFNFENIPFAGFSNLNRIWLNGLPRTPHILDGVKGLLVRLGSAQVERLELGSMVEDVMQPNFSPMLKHLTISASQFTLSPSCVPFLGSLTSLVVSDLTVVQPSFWRALQNVGIRLQKLKGGRLRQPIINYLLSYSGLQDITLQWSDEEFEEIGIIVPEFFHAVLPRHQDTMQSISFGPPMLVPWPITQSYLDEGVYLCRKLKYLSLIYHFPYPNEKRTHTVIPLAKLFSEISDNLPQLETLQLEHTRKFMTMFGCGDGCRASDSLRTVERAFANYVVRSKSQFTAKRQPQFVLEAAESTFISKSVSAERSGSESDLASGSRSVEYYRFDLNPSDDLELQADEAGCDCRLYSDD
ncbi:hypothetical protein H1R20_g2993, partial [Candolleomyces eurysporus]